MTTNTLEIHKENGVAFIKLNRPKVFNSFNAKMALDLQNELKNCGQDREVRAIVLSGSGKAFCAGQDLAEATSGTFDFKIALEQHYAPIVRLIRQLEKPVIAAVNGIAAGAGTNIALSCDIVLASDKASFTQAFSKIGLVPDSAGTYFLPRLVGTQNALALMMTSDKITAVEAARLGIVYKVFAAAHFEEEVDTIAKAMAKMPTKALAMTKKLINASLENDLDAQLQLETKMQIAASKTEDYTEGVTAFVEKRQPNFKGS